MHVSVPPQRRRPTAVLAMVAGMSKFQVENTRSPCPQLRHHLRPA